MPGWRVNVTHPVHNHKAKSIHIYHTWHMEKHKYFDRFLEKSKADEKTLGNENNISYRAMMMTFDVQ